MPSPLGHSLGALAVGWLVAGRSAAAPGWWRQVAILVAVGIAPDLDLLWGRHSMETHSLGAAVLIATLAAWQRWPVASSRGVIWFAVALVWLSHPMLDALARDTSAPIGVMAFWPFSDAHMQTGLSVFGPISRRYWRDDFWSVNASSALREVLVLGPVLAIVLLGNWLNRRN